MLAKTNKIIIILGTRPEIIKTSALLRLLHERRDNYRLIHTGQHFSYAMDKLFFKQLGLPQPQYQLNFKSRAGEGRLAYVRRMAEKIEKMLIKEAPCTVLVQGDTNSVLAGALASRQVPGVKLGHIEAGLRSYDLAMPEEKNRIKTDHISDYLFAPTTGARKVLLREKIKSQKIFVTGNTIVDAVISALPIAKKKIALTRWVKPGEKFFLVTLHRQENVDSKARLQSILQGLDLVAKRWKHPILFPVHPRTAQKLKAFGLQLPPGMRPIQPVGFLEFLRLEEAAELILSDSGGVQEEACILGVPCVTLRTTTERPETVMVGANIIAGYRAPKILKSAETMILRKGGWKNPFGDGKSSEMILRILR